MSEQNKTRLMWVVALLILIAAVAFVVIESRKPGKYDTFAQCIADTGAKFYGAFWCPHCQNQKAMFGKAAKKLPYVECSTPDGQSQLKICKDAGVTGYPLWTFADGTRLEGEVKLDVLAEKTACTLPQ